MKTLSIFALPTLALMGIFSMPLSASAGSSNKLDVYIDYQRDLYRTGYSPSTECCSAIKAYDIVNTACGCIRPSATGCEGAVDIVFDAMEDRCGGSQDDMNVRALCVRELESRAGSNYNTPKINICEIDLTDLGDLHMDMIRNFRN